MSRRIPWVATTVIIVVAVGLGAWALSTPTTTITPSPPAPPAPGATTISVGRGVAFAGGIPPFSGIENIYIMVHGSGYNPATWLGNAPPSQRHATIENSGDNVNIPYENLFHIVVAVKGKAPENMAYAVRENIQVELRASGHFTIGPENAPNVREHIFENSGHGTTSGWIRMNVVWDNGGNGYRLAAGTQINLEFVRLWTWR